MEGELCRRCPDLAANRRRIVQGYGPAPARVLFVGEAPGRHGADQTGVPFTRDRSGRQFQQMLIELGLSDETDPGTEQPRLRCFVTNVVRCNPPGNRTPLPAEIAACLPYLWQDVEMVRPEIVVPVGGIALRAVTREILGSEHAYARAPITAAHAQVWATGRECPAWIVPLRHPARISNAEMRRFVAVVSGVIGEQMLRPRTA